MLRGLPVTALQRRSSSSERYVGHEARERDRCQRRGGEGCSPADAVIRASSLRPREREQADAGQERSERHADQLPVPVDARVNEPCCVRTDGRRGKGLASSAQGGSDRSREHEEQECEPRYAGFRQRLDVEVVCVGGGDRGGAIP